MWRRLIILCLASTPLAACASFSSAAPSCNGWSRRPLNRSLWDWENAPNSASPWGTSLRRDDVASPMRVGKPLGDIPAAGSQPPRFNIAASYRACGEEG
jgi:type IV secretion system protein VirB7